MIFCLSPSPVFSHSTLNSGFVLKIRPEAYSDLVQQKRHYIVHIDLAAFPYEFESRGREIYEISKLIDLSVSSYSNKNFSTSIALDGEQYDTALASVANECVSEDTRERR